MDTTIPPFKNVAGRVTTGPGAKIEKVWLVAQVDESISPQFQTLLEDSYGKACRNFLSIEHQNKGFEDSFKVNGIPLMLENKSRSLKKIEELTNLLRQIGKSENAFPIDKKYLGGIFCAENLGFDIFKNRITKYEKAEISQAHTLYMGRKVANSMAHDVLELTSKFFK